jgi:hypothetical protein
MGKISGRPASSTVFPTTYQRRPLTGGGAGLFCGNRNHHIEVSNMPAFADKYFTASDVFAGTGLRPAKQFQWTDRSITIPSKKDKLPSGSGDPHLMSIETVLQLAITVELVGLRVQPKAAARAARKFTDEGQTGRAPGVCFGHGKTILVITPDGATVRNLDFTASIFEAVNDDVSIVVDLNRIVERVHNVLSKH